MLDVPGWPGHLPGQHADVRLTAEDGYSAQRSYSIASSPEPDRLEFTVQRLDDGEVSPYLAGIAEPGDQFDLRGPIGGWFTWSPQAAGQRPLLLLAGGSGVVPLMSMIRAHGAARSEVPVGLIYSVRSPSDVIYQTELSERSASSPLTVDYRYTRSAPPGTRAAPHRRRRAGPARPAARRQARHLRLRPVRLRRGGHVPAGRGGPRPRHDQDRALRPHRHLNPPTPTRPHPDPSPPPPLPYSGRLK